MCYDGEFLDELRRWGNEGARVAVITGELQAFQEALALMGFNMLREWEDWQRSH